MKRSSVSTVLVAVCLLGWLAWREVPSGELLVRWTMIHVNQNRQGDAHLIEFVNGPTVLIDCGLAAQSDSLIDLLRKRGVRELDTVWITHAHDDHYGGIYALIGAGIGLKEVRMNLPEPSLCESEKPWGCNLTDVGALTQALNLAKVPLRSIAQGDRLEVGPGSSLRVLYAFNGVETPVGRTDVNDTSLIVLLTAGKTRALFTGDLNARIGGYLAAQGHDLQADILKVPHHGTDSLAPNVFFDRVGSKVALVPYPRTLWQSERSRRVRDYFQASGQRVFVNGLHGNIQVLIRSDEYQVLTEYF